MSKWGKGRGGRPWRRLREAVAARDGYTCRKCKLPVALEDGDCDHVVPEHKGGKTVMDNLAWLCRYPCHFEKTEREAAEAQGHKLKTRINDDGWPS